MTEEMGIRTLELRGDAAEEMSQTTLELSSEQTIELRKFALQMAIGPVLASEDPTNIDFGSVVEAAKTYAHFLLTGENDSPVEEDKPVPNLELVT